MGGGLYGFCCPGSAYASCGLRDLTKTYHREAVGELSEEFKLSAVQVQELMDLGADHDAGTGVYLAPGPDEPPMRVDHFFDHQFVPCPRRYLLPPES